jgi:hypothetical protein
MVSAPLLCGRTHAQSESQYNSIPNPYLVLIRDPIVHEQLRVTEAQKQAIARLTDELDGPFLAIRGQSLEVGGENLRRLIADAESKMNEILSASQRKRLGEILLRAQGVRGLLRPDVADKMKLSNDQRVQIEAIIHNNEETFQTLRKQAQDESESQQWLDKRVAQLRDEERKKIVAALNESQLKWLVKLQGQDIDVTRLGRVAFKVPEFSSSGVWINSPVLTMEDLRGKVLALHFWAFG